MNAPSGSFRSDSRDGPCYALLTALCCAVYFTSYLTRKGYDASILAICEETGLARTAAGLASTAAVALYGSGQFVTGFLADRFDPRRIVFLALLVTASCNLAMPMAAGAACVPAMAALWAVNGFSQAMFWPPLVKIIADRLSPERFKSAVFWISVASNASIVAVFLLVSGCIRFAGWRTTFDVVAVAAFAMAAIWRGAMFRSRRATPPSGDSSAESKESSKGGAARGSNVQRSKTPILPLLGASGMFFAMGAITCQGVMRDGIEVWAPSIVRDVFGLGTADSVFSVTLLPVFGVASMAAARALRRALGGEIKSAAALFGIGLVCASALFVSGGWALWFGLPVLATLSACMHGANLMLIGELPGRFSKYGCVGAVSGILNAFTYVGAAASIYGFAAIHERFSGWRPVFALWIAVLAAAMCLSLRALAKWNRFAAAEDKR